VNFAEWTPAGTVHVCAAPVKQKVSVVTPPLVLVAHGAAATESGESTPIEAKTKAANGKAIATDRILRISFLHRGSNGIFSRRPRKRAPD
jgi:hypothetical protein